ncbi:MAG: HAMP domain-containing protein [Chloroflexi bacterium]|nr:HAMP domain-containing protein [Chloroflexota bacterium]
MSANQATPVSAQSPSAGLSLAVLQVFAVLFGAVVGSHMLISPHQYTLPVYDPIAPNLSLWGVVFLLAAGSMAAAVVIIRARPLLLLAHLFSAATLLLLAYLVAAAGNWLGPTVYTILGAALIAAPLAQRLPTSRTLRGGDSFRIVITAVALGIGLNLVLAPDKGAWSDPSYLSFARWLGAAFLVAGAALAAEVLLKPSRRAPIWLAHLTAAAPFLAYLVVGPGALRAWPGMTLYGLLALLLAALPWLEERAHLIALDSLRARLTLAFSAGAVVPLLLVVPIALGMQEEAAVARSLAQHRALAEDAAQEVADFVSYHSAAVIALGNQPGLLEAPLAAQRQALRAVQAAYPAALTVNIVDLAGNQRARSDDFPLTWVGDSPNFQRASRTRRVDLFLARRPETGRSILAIVAPVLDQSGEAKGFVAASVETTRFSNVLARIPTMGAAAAYLVDEQGRLIAATDPSASAFADLSGEPAVGALLRGEEAGSFRSGQGPDDRLVGYARVAGLSWGVVVEEPVAVVVAESRRQRDAAFPGTLAVGALAAALGVALSHGMVQPLREVIRTVGRIAAGSFDPDPSGPSPSISELRQLTSSVDQMRTRLRHATAESERLLAETQRHAAELDIVNRELHAFNYSVAHDLKTPLRAMKGFSQAVLELYGDKLDEQGRKYLTSVHRGSKRMEDYLDALLELGRIARAEMKRQRVDLSRMASETAGGLQSLDPKRSVEFIIAPDVVVFGDRDLLRLALENLLGNAWKFTSKHAAARIEFGVADLDGQRAYFVRDDGAGFDMEFAHKLLVAFERLHDESEFPGLGAGMAMVQRIIARHGGRVWAEAKVERGATFYFTLG